MFTNAKILLFLTNKVLDIYSFDSKLNDRVEFPSKVYADLKVSDREKFKELVVELLAHTNLKKQSAVLALGETAVFTKSGAVKEDSDKEVLAEQFENNIPFETDKTARLEITDGTLKLIAANKEVYEIIIEASKIFEWDIETVVPVGAFGTTEKETMLTQEEVASLLSGAKEIKEANFLNQKQERTPMGELKITKKSHTKLIVLGGCIVLLLIALFFSRSLLNNLRGSDKIVFSPKPLSPPSLSPAPTVSASPSTQEKENVKIKVLNGTGTPGQAAQVKTLMEGLGYSNITVGNAQTKTADTLVVTTASFSGQLKDEIVSSLQKDFTSVKPQVLENIEGFNVVITTGK